MNGTVGTGFPRIGVKPWRMNRADEATRRAKVPQKLGPVLGAPVALRSDKHALFSVSFALGSFLTHSPVMQYPRVLGGEAVLTASIGGNGHEAWDIYLSSPQRKYLDEVHWHMSALPFCLEIREPLILTMHTQGIKIKVSMCVFLLAASLPAFKATTRNLHWRNRTGQSRVCKSKVCFSCLGNGRTQDRVTGKDPVHYV